jgi:hypothetical protein
LVGFFTNVSYGDIVFLFENKSGCC